MADVESLYLSQTLMSVNTNGVDNYQKAAESLNRLRENESKKDILGFLINQITR